jgi:uncharacterized cupin superfamily protein
MPKIKYDFEFVHVLNGKVVTTEEIDKYLAEKGKESKKSA